MEKLCDGQVWRSKTALKAMAETPEIPEIIGIENELQSAIHFYSGQIKNLSTDGEISATGMHDKKGVLVLSPPTDGVFKTLKLLRNDVILKVNGVHINSVAELQPEMEKGKIKTITIWRNQSEVVLKN